MEKRLKDRVASLIAVLSERVFGKEHVIALSLLSAVAGESIFLVGPPGVAKSMVARRLKLAFSRRIFFDYLMSRFSTPDEIFGPVSISKLKNEDRFERITDGYLPSATVVFLDEIWKAGPAIQNALLTVLNEKIYRNGSFTLNVPLKGLVAASNELPAAGQGLEALWDRFLLRVWVGGVEEISDFDRMITSSDESDPEVTEELAISDEEFFCWQKQIAEIKINYSILEVIHILKDKIEEYNRLQENDNSVTVPLYVSDRRWKKLVRLLRTSAFLNGQKEVRLSDCLLLSYGLWSELGQIKLVDEMVGAAVQQSAEGYLLNLKDIDRELDTLKSELSADAAIQENQDPGLQLVDTYYYQIERVRLAGKLLMFASDYQALDNLGKLFYLHKDKYKSQCYILKKYDLSMRNKVPQKNVYSLKRGHRSVLINDYEYPLLCTPECLPLPAVETDRKEDITVRFRGLEERMDRMEKDCQDLFRQETDYCRQHLFLNGKQRDQMASMLRHQQTAIARCKNELNELKHAYRKEKEEYPTEGTENLIFGGTPPAVL